MASLSTFLFNNSLKLRNRTSKMMVGILGISKEMKSFEHDPSLWDDGHLNSGVLAKQGYAVLVQDTRGRFSSSGEFVPVQHAAGIRN